MGASESKQSRSTTLERDEGQRIVISEDVLRLLEGKEVKLDDQSNASEEGLEEAWTELEEERKKLQQTSARMKEMLQMAFRDGQRAEAERNENKTEEMEKHAEEKINQHLDEKEKTQSRLNEHLAEKEQELAQAEMRHKQELEEVEKKFADKVKATEEQFNTAAEEVQRKYRHRHTAPVCEQARSIVTQCYTENPNQTLKCSQEVKKFIECVNQSRLDSLKAS